MKLVKERHLLLVLGLLLISAKSNCSGSSTLSATCTVSFCNDKNVLTIAVEVEGLIELTVNVNFEEGTITVEGLDIPADVLEAILALLAKNIEIELCINLDETTLDVNIGVEINCDTLLSLILSIDLSDPVHSTATLTLLGKKILDLDLAIALDLLK